MSIPKNRPPLAAPKRGHYFDPVPEADKLLDGWQTVLLVMADDGC